MPLAKGCGKKAVDRNIRRLIDEGRPVKQAVAVALDVRRRTCKSRTGRAMGNDEHIGRHVARELVADAMGLITEAQAMRLLEKHGVTGAWVKAVGAPPTGAMRSRIAMASAHDRYDATTPPPRPPTKRELAEEDRMLREEVRMGRGRGRAALSTQRVVVQKPRNAAEDASEALQAARDYMKDARLATNKTDLLDAYSEAVRELAVAQYLGHNTHREDEQANAIFHAILAKMH